MNLEIRELEFNDVYPMLEILKSVDIDVDQEDLTEDLSLMAGIRIIKNTIGNMKTAKKEVNNFLGSLFNISGEEFGKLNLVNTMICMNQIKNLDGIDDFLGFVKGMMK